MQLTDELRRRLATEQSIFRAQLLREDIVRLEKLEALTRSTADAAEYRRAARRLGWTPMDARTNELGAALDALIDAVRDDHAELALKAWIEITQIRIERMVGCLSTPAPRPID